MRVAVCFVLLCLVALSWARQSEWTNCGDDEDHFIIKQLDFQPYPAVLGQNVTFTVSGTLDEIVTGGNVTLDLKYNVVPIVTSKSIEFCDVVDGLCPVFPGTRTFTQSLYIPPTIPEGLYKWTAKAVDQHNAELFCAQFKLQLQAY